ncbi:hypothetical protein D621_07135 [beta proteobacterium AAP51]|nr:hypothetical protein D621_07135 [beta proteobacterium AAP51]
MLLAVLGALGGCSTLTPQVFSPYFDDLPAQAQSRQTHRAPTLHEAMAEAQQLQFRYINAARQLSEVNAGSSAALLGLSALAVFKGITNPTTRDLAGLGILASGTYAYGTTMVSRPRQALYLAGADALACALTASQPYDLAAGFVRGAPDSLETLAKNADQAALQLEQALRALRPLAVDRQIKVNTESPQPALCQGASLTPPPKPPASAGADALRLWELQDRNVRKLTRSCAPSRPIDVTLTAHPEVKPMVEALEAALRSLSRQSQQAGAQIGVIETAPAALWDRMMNIQVKVAGEVIKTEPDIGAVRSAAQGLRSGAFALTGAAAFAAPAASAASGAASMPQGTPQIAANQPSGEDDTKPRASPRPTAELQNAQIALDAARSAHDPLRAKLAQLKARVDQVSTPLARCGSAGSITAATLNLLPDDTEREVTAGQSISFHVSGGTGIPNALVLAADGSGARNLGPPTIDGARFKFVYSAAATAKEGTRETVQFTDAAGQLATVVHVTVRAAAK